MTVQERIRPAQTFAPEVASLNMGTMGFGLFPMLDRYKSFKHDWEPAALEASRDLVFKNTYADIEHLLTTLSPLGTRFEFECYDTSHLYNLKYFLDRGLVKAPLFIQTCFGILGGIGSHPDDIMHMKRTADRLFGDQYQWSVLGAGARQMSIVAMAASMGGNVRVGLEDSLWGGPGRLAHDVDREMFGLVPFGAVRSQFGLGELSGGVLDGALVVGEGEVHERFLVSLAALLAEPATN